ncbi:hypothetical protein GCK32_021684, partial [Trichostrongylus colubriformis]
NRSAGQIFVSVVWCMCLIVTQLLQETHFPLPCAFPITRAPRRKSSTSPSHNEMCKVHSFFGMKSYA